ncbi:hypothetical protein MIND_01172700 [Mycena indigotica]|uniref:Uncharacterized protein n=1 Tax=Mycena indigotica TaxID=2126181 RepID=A0A8H6VWI4_9AGAR|nr:uncharacterized protein MIND_01172700 [Mycena indigotica]KAF7292743.1 hypothetical protein MIND_01172700 [Mycena indigotica]
MRPSGRIKGGRAPPTPTPSPARAHTPIRPQPPMFAPFTRVSDFFPGLFLWVDPTCFGRSLATALGSGGPLTPRDLRPCLVVAVDAAARTFSAAPLSATQPQQHADGWAPIDTPPLLTWKLNNAWLWVGPPPTLAMVFAQPKIMHPNKDVYYSAPPVSTANLAHYWERRAAYEAARTSTGSKHPGLGRCTYLPPAQDIIRKVLSMRAPAGRIYVYHIDLS